MRVLLVGGGAREHAIASTLHDAGAKLVVASPNVNPGLERLAQISRRIDSTLPAPLVELAKETRVDYAVLGPDPAIAAGVGDALRVAEIPVVGPSKSGGQIETSKSFGRELLLRHQIDAQPKFVALRNLDEVDGRIGEIPEPFVVKPVGLTGGKGVWVQGADFATAAEGTAYAKKLLASGGDGVVVEQKLDGEEFSLLAFVTDSGVYPMPAVHDYKRVGEGDTGPNTGGMGSFSQRDHLLPFLPRSAYEKAVEILRQTVDALKQDGIPYRGILYGGFMQTLAGPVVVEFNARFGDPEALNVLTLYEAGDFDLLMHGVAVGRVDPTLLRFRQRATVVKYLVPRGYGRTAIAGDELTIDEPAIEALGVRLRYGAVDATGPGRVRLTKSRGIALVGEASAIHEASHRVELALPCVGGPYEIRHDIGSKEDLTKRTEHLRKLFAPSAKPSPIPLSVAPAAALPSSAGEAEFLLG